MLQSSEVRVSGDLVGRRVGELRRGEANLVVRGVEHGEVALEEAEPVNEVEALARLRADVAHDEEDLVTLATNERVERALETTASTLVLEYGSSETHRPDLSVGSELVRVAADVEEQALQAGILRGGDLQ